MSIELEQLWQQTKPEPFYPNSNQKRAILHIDSPLFLTAGPGSGKTRVLLWRSLNLIVFHDIKPEEIFLSTFTEKAAFQLKEGLRSLLGLVTNLTGKPYDISKMYVGTVHSLCQKLLTDRRFLELGQRSTVPVLKDALGQYFYLSRRRYWESILENADFDLDIAQEMINQFFNHNSISKHNAVNNCISLFNRFSEECLTPEQILARIQTTDLDDPDTFVKLTNLYDEYLRSLQQSNPPQADFSLIQQYALNFLEKSPHCGNIFKHIIIDEYQDTNTIQERIFFKLASGFKNICVVGDDDQALYRFRGATVENFVQFPSRCQEYLNCSVTEIPLNINYRSRYQIVEFYNDFITRQNWRTADGNGFYRLVNKNITAFNGDRKTSIIASTPTKPDLVCEEIALLVRDLIKSGKVKDANQIAFLYPSLKSKQVERMIDALEDVGLKVYAPRAKRFLEVDEAIAVFGVYLLIFGKPVRGDFRGADYNDFHQWLNKCEEIAENLSKEDQALKAFIEEKREEIKTALNDYRILSQVAIEHKWDKNQPYDPALMKRQLCNATGLSSTAKKNLGNVYFDRLVKQKLETKQSCTLGYVINASTSVDWSVLDLFYRLCIFNHFKEMFDLAETGKDEGPICNMGLISQYLARFTDEYTHIITAQFLEDDRLQVTFFMGFLYSLFRLGETEYEDADDPFPRGRIPFLTVHQSKGLEFPVVILGNPRKDPKLQRVEEIVKPILDRQGEPLERMADFDVMRMFYVALSRAKNLLVIAHFKGSGQKLTFPFNEMLNDRTITRIPDFDLHSLPEAKESNDDLPKNYSYTSDYLLYQRCPRQYMIFRKYGFVASRSQTMFFGSVVHKTIEDLHYILKAKKEKQTKMSF
ncbi:UvrD-helicase domain-containing protein [Geminocystis sp.]|uniref:UvrD-helicase domain-containing protein n=1 Tax=Geminocystis sp. TaxID=2664100 RepID=UPI003593B1A3